MARKRKVVVEKTIPANVEEQSDDMGWKEWLILRYARAWYWLVALFIDIIIFFELQRTVGLEVVVSAMIAIILVVVELVLFLRIWGKGGPLGKEYEE